MVLQSVNDKTSKTGQLEQLLIQPTVTASGDLREPPAEPNPYIDQVDGQGHQQKTQGRIGRRGPCAHLASATITGFDAKASPVTAPDLVGRHLQMDEDEDLPHGPSLETFGAFRSGKGTTYDHLGCALFAPAITAKVCCAP